MPSKTGRLPKEPQFISACELAELAETSGQTILEAMRACLARNIWPERFRRNQGVITSETQARLLATKVFIAGCGGLGGEIASLLCRMGIGHFRICDPDVFEESNLNRQRFCTEATLGCPKATVVKKGLEAIASYLSVEANVSAITLLNSAELLAGMDIVIDCLDSVSRKKMLEECAAKAGLPYLHGSVLGRDGFIYIDMPGKDRLSALYADIPAEDKSLGPNPVMAPTVTATASLMASLLLNALSSNETNSPLLHLDTSCPELESFL